MAAARGRSPVHVRAVVLVCTPLTALPSRQIGHGGSVLPVSSSEFSLRVMEAEFIALAAHLQAAPEVRKTRPEMPGSCRGTPPTDQRLDRIQQLAFLIGFTQIIIDPNFDRACTVLLAHS